MKIVETSCSKTKVKVPISVLTSSLALDALLCLLASRGEHVVEGVLADARTNVLHPLVLLLGTWRRHAVHVVLALHDLALRVGLARFDHLQNERTLLHCTFKSKRRILTQLASLLVLYNSKQNCFFASFTSRIWMFSSGIIPFGSLSCES